MNDANTVKFDRIGRKTRKNMTLSPDLVGVLDELVGKTHRSAFAERAMWGLLVDEYGEERVRAALEDVQQQMDDDERLREPTQVELTA